MLISVRIREINGEYYQNLLTSAKDERNSLVKQRKAAESLLQRSEEIWQTFHPKQQRRWRKLWSENSLRWTIVKKEKTIKHL